MDNESAPSIEEQSNEYEKILERAKLYHKFGQVALALTNYADSLHASAESTLDEEQIKIEYQSESLINQIEVALGEVDKSLENQLNYNIINHKQINTKEALETELQSGTAIPELDVRFDQDGKPWISHSPRAGARVLFSEPIHTLESSEVEEIGQRLSLEEGLSMIETYQKDNANHKVVIEIKELGGTLGSRYEYLENVKTLLEEHNLTDAAIFATLSPSILKSVHDVFPNNSKILNGGIAPIISYDLAEKTLGQEEQQEFAVKFPGGELFFSNSTEIADRDDGYGKQTGYLWTRLPKETVNTLKKMNENGQLGAASLTLVNKFANILEKFSPKTAESVRRHYAEQVHKLGLRVQVAISKTNPAESLTKTREQMGEDTIFYSDVSPGEFAAGL